MTPHRSAPPSVIPTARPLAVRRLGLLPYAEGIELQADLVRRRRSNEIADTLLLLQHPHVITLGSGSHPEHILADESERRRLGIQIYQAGRGGDVTYHGPGQLVGYPILDLKPDRCDLHRYLRDIESVLIEVLHDLGIQAGRIDGLTGVWAGDRKLAAIGVRVSSGWITSHGFALNVSTDLAYFDSIVPCGIRDQAVGSVSGELGRDVEIPDVEEMVVRRFAERFGLEPST
ncbi:MAG: lipoyl(octanoyl) transferase LipB [Gemmatimonadota bacterium]